MLDGMSDSIQRSRIEKHSTEIDRQSPTGLILFYSNYGSISCRFWDKQCGKISRPSNPSQRSIKVTESGTIR